MDSLILLSQSSENKRGVISKMWQRCKSLSRAEPHAALNKKSKSLPLHRVTSVEKGCIPIFVGPEKERFVINTEQVNHPLFQILLEEAESEYGYSGNNGPLIIPCDVECFLDLLVEMDSCDEGTGEDKGCSFVARTHSSYRFLIPPRPIIIALAA